MCVIIPVDGIVSIGRPVPLYFSTDTPMVFPDVTTDFSERESGKHHMTNNIALFSGKMMVGHDGLLSGLSVGRASLYQKTRHVLSLSHVVQLQVESTLIAKLQVVKGYNIKKSASITNDCIIASSARTIGATVYTQNRKDFEAILEVTDFKVVFV